MFVDINECMLDYCGVDANCTNTRGSYRCFCPTGYKGDPNYHCYSKFKKMSNILVMFLPKLLQIMEDPNYTV